MTYTFIAERCSDLPVAACCRVMKVSTSRFYAWRACPVTDRNWADAALTNTIFDIHVMSRWSYGSPRIHASYASATIGSGAPGSGSSGSCDPPGPTASTGVEATAAPVATALNQLRTWWAGGSTRPDRIACGGAVALAAAVRRHGVGGPGGVSDNACEFVECGRDLETGEGVGGEFVVSASEVLDEGVALDDHSGGPVALQAPHWSQPGLKRLFALE